MDLNLNFEDTHDGDPESLPDEPAPENTAANDADPPSEHESLRELHLDLLSRYRSALLASDSAICPDLVTGDTAEELEASFERARHLVAGIREAVMREQLTLVPAGAPGRSSGAPGSAHDKIRSGLARLAAS